jgi:thiol-disulfide isomerase/thioredoxin
MKRYALAQLVLAVVAVTSFAADADKGSIEPAQPKWGDRIQLIYRAGLPGATLHATDTVTALVTIRFPGRFEERRIHMARVGDRLQAEMTVPDEASFLVCYFVAKDAFGGPAHAMIYTREGSAARGAWEQSMTQPFLEKDYRGSAAHELALYPDNWEVYRDKWFCAGLFEPAERDNMIRADLALIEQKAAGRPLGALYALHYGYLLLGEEPAARSALREMVDRFPNEWLTATSLDSYAYENMVHHFPGNGLQEVHAWAMDFFRRNPLTAAVRQGLDSIGGVDMPLETTEAICIPWMKDDPENPKPYLHLAQSYQREKVKTREALATIETALDLLAAGQLRLHGDIYDKMTDLLLPSAYVTAADLARQNGQFGKALAYAKAAETMGSQTLATGYAMEAQIWEMLGRTANTKAALKEAWQRGSRDAYAKLAERYPEALHEAGAPAPTRKDAPSFRATTLDGKELDSTGLRGKVIVANFWFTGCGPCKAEIPGLNKLTKQFQSKDVVFLAFTLDDDEATLRRFLKEYPFDYTIVPRADKIATQFGIEAYPSHVIIGRDGKIESRLTGAGEHRAEELQTIVARLIEN